MPSGYQTDIQAGYTAGVAATTSMFQARSTNLGMSERQMRLDHYYRYYRCLRYESRAVDWDGRDRCAPWELEQAASQKYVPQSGSPAPNIPLKARFPVVQYNLAKLIVDRLTGLLFSARQAPHAVVVGDAKTEDWLTGFADDSNLWAAMVRTRMLGGAMGSVALGAQFVRGVPVVEVFDPRHSLPTFEDLETLRVLSLETRYQYPVEERDEKGRPVETMYWYRRIIDDVHDVVFEPAPVGDGDEPAWQVRREVIHRLGVCPVVWVQNTEVPQSVDGDPDCQGIYDELDAIDYLTSEAFVGTMANCDPTLVLSTIKEFGAFSKGSSNAIVLNPGDSANYLELAGSGPKAALDLAEKLRARALEVAQVVLEHADVGNRTATEIERRYEAMHARADLLRVQYGQRGLVPLLEMAVEMAHKLGRPRLVQAGAPLVQSTVRLSPRVDTDATGQIVVAARVLGPGGKIAIAWPSHERHSTQETVQAVTAAAGARAAALVDADTAARYVAQRFGVEDVGAMLRKLREEQEAKAASDDRAIMDALDNRGDL